MSDTTIDLSTDGSPQTTRPALTLSQAAESCQTSRSTIRRKLDAKEFPNAYRDGGDDGPWMVPVTDLIAAGLKPNAPRAEPEQVGQSEASAPIQGQPEEIARLERELFEERARRKAAEEIAAERQRSLDDLRMALRMLGPGEQSEQGSGLPQTQGHDTPTEQGSSAPRRKWWQRATV
jgi:predicted DNA-binding transcriptional regulator AlpA